MCIPPMFTMTARNCNLVYRFLKKSASPPALKHCAGGEKWRFLFSDWRARKAGSLHPQGETDCRLGRFSRQIKARCQRIRFGKKKRKGGRKALFYNKKRRSKANFAPTWSEWRDLNSRPLDPQTFCFSKSSENIRNIRKNRKIGKQYNGEIFGFSICSTLIPPHSTAINHHFIS